MLMVTGCSYHIEAKSRWFTYRVYGGSCPIESHAGAGGGADVAHICRLLRLGLILGKGHKHTLESKGEGRGTQNNQLTQCHVPLPNVAEKPGGCDHGYEPGSIQ